MKLGKKKKTTEDNEDFLAKEAKEIEENAPEYTLDIPEDEIWTYQIEGLQAPSVGKSHKNETGKKVLVVIILLVAISCSIFLSVRAVHNDEFKYKDLGNNQYELIKYSNPGEETKVRVDYVNGDKSKPITVIHEYMLNCDEKVQSVSIGKDVSKIDGKSFYSCWGLQNVFVDDDNPYYCDLDGVLYTKDMKTIVFYPTDHDRYLRAKYGYAYIDKKGEQHSKLVDDDGKEMEELWGTTEKYDEKYLEEYNKQVRTYVIPSSVETIGELAFAYSNLTDIYFPEGVKRIETMGVFKNTVLLNLYSYTTDGAVTDTTFSAVKTFSSKYNSLPNGLEYIGSDAFTYDSGLSYLFIPKSVKEIGHHAFWDAVFKEDGNLKGITEINTDADEKSFDSKTLGDQWKPQYDYMLFKKSVNVNYSAQRQ